MLVADRYRLESPIGRGAMGEVWRATDEVLGRPVAMKLLLGDDSDAQTAARFRLEGQTAARLSHPHVVAVFDFGAWEGRFYLVMELVEGRSLAQELAAGGSLPAPRVAQVAAQTAAGLASAHRQGIVHRDIKPGNLMSDADGTVKLGDFGIARFVDDPAAALTQAGQIVGTSLYLAPERALGQPAGPASDVYSLGCVLYQLLTGRPPFHADTATAILYQHIDTVPVPPRRLGADVPPAFENYLLGMLAKQPEERPSAQEVADWFASGAWQGRAQSLPDPAPHAGRHVGGGPGQAPVRAAASGPVPPARPRAAASRPGGGPLPAPAPGPAPAEGGTATTYMLPNAPRQGRGRRAAPAPHGTGGAREFVRRRPRVASVIAGTVAFFAAVLIGMAVFSPDTTSAETPQVEIGSTPDTLSGDGGN
ncbi:serine/threonine-protein kinase [Streptomyces sp. WAC05374]|uniref:serine/threonine-protein kinase n=1 Tax=Streptomyces sp. WAC05374 TaxID=2487420 RepID=UPI00163B9173|nr:serine/threonine-protein kinase [Streptomyces sp. WAC05374]